MPHHEHIKAEGRIGDIFFHRFVIELPTGEKILADVGPKGADAFPLKSGTQIIVEGEMKPSELKVERIAKKGGTPVVIEHKKKHEHDHHAPADPDTAKRAVTRAGYVIVGEPRRKPKHFEILGRKSGHLVECHVEFDGHIRKEKPVDARDDKWSSDLNRVA